MPCADPIKAHKPLHGGALRFKPPTDGKAYNTIQIPCGYCISCRSEQARQTAVRITHEATQWTENSFITLTYTDKTLPPHGSLDYNHLVKFWEKIAQANRIIEVLRRRRIRRQDV